MEKLLSAPVICTSANKGRGIDEVMKKALEIAKNEASKIERLDNANQKIKIFDDSIEKYIAEIEKKFALSLNKNAYSLR